MTDKPKGQHGGPREGGGRPRKLGAAFRIADKYIAADGTAPLPKWEAPESPEASPATERKGKRVRELEDLLARFMGETLSPVATATELKELALGTLKNIMERSPSDQARVGAAREVLNRADLETVPKGKKAAAKATAEEKAKEGGKFAPPPQPKTADKSIQ